MFYCLLFIKFIVFKGSLLSEVEKSFWSIICGRLEPALSSCTSTDDRLWCYLNSAIEPYFSAFLSDSMSNIVDDNSIIESELTLSSIFDEICAVIYFY